MRPHCCSAILALAAASAACYRVTQHSYSDAACSISLVESLPENVTFNETVLHPSTFNAYRYLVRRAVGELNFAELYWTLRAQDLKPYFPNLASQGEELFNLIGNATVPIRIAYNVGSLGISTADVTDLAKLANVQAVGLNFTRLFGDGVLHTKAIVADRRHAYVGSSNMDWRSLTQIQELGILLTDCPTLAEDLNKIFEVYFLTGQMGRVPSPWPSGLIGSINATHPWVAEIGGFKYSIFIGASPSSLCPPNRSRDIDAILTAIRTARQFVHVAVMDYMAALYNYNTGQMRFWSPIDNALREAAFRGVRVRLLVSHWRHSGGEVARFVRSLTALSSLTVPIEGKFYIVPSYNKEQASIPFARVNHNKFMVTETTAVVCTSNWEGSYFTNTAGVALSITELGTAAAGGRDDAAAAAASIVSQAQQIFMRDWTSPYAHEQPIDYDYDGWHNAEGVRWRSISRPIHDWAFEADQL